MKPLLSLLGLGMAALATAAAEPAITVTGGKTDELNVVCTVAMPADAAAGQLSKLVLPDGTWVRAQVVGPTVLDKQDQTRYLVFVLPRLKAGETETLKPMADGGQATQFRFDEGRGEYSELRFGTRPVLRYINAKHDPANHFLTFKPFHQVFDPAEGKTLLTTGPVATPKDGLYPHHRGLFFGFNKITYGDKKTADIWHGTDNVFSQQDKYLGIEVGPVMGRERSAISWHGKDGATFATEEREVAAYDVPGGTLIDWATVLSTSLSVVKLDGDPQHAGFHFRAAQGVNEAIEAEKALAKKENRKPKPADTYYLRPDGKGAPGETRNWDPTAAKARKADARTINLPWNAMSFVLGGKRYTVLRIDHPDNPKESRGSERDYGRFGDYFEYTLTPDKPLKLKYRLWVQEGEMTVDQCRAMAAAFVHPPAVKVALK
jgi:hypothetical protein